MKELVYAIPLQPVTKKNHGRIVRLKTGRTMFLPSKQYTDYEKSALQYIHPPEEPIEAKVNVECKYYLQTRRRTDLVNLLQCTLDILVKSGVLSDDNYNVVFSVDGSRVFYDKANPRTEIRIEVLE